MRLTWLADELRKAGLKVVEVGGWKTRGSATFDPVGVTWHATAGSRSGTAQGEVNVILNGSETAPPPIAQIMAWRDGVLYICAAGRCNHNKVGWDGPNKGLGNTKLLGIEMANDNRGEPWPDVQLDAVRRATAVIMRRLGADPMRRLAAHYEHQPYATRPPGEGSTKSDPAGVRMTDERPRVAAIMRGDDDVTKDEIKAAVRELLVDDDDPVAVKLRARPWQYAGGGLQGSPTTLDALSDSQGIAAAIAALHGEVLAELGKLQQPTITLTAEQVETIGTVLAQAAGGALSDLQQRLRAAGLALAAPVA